MVKDELKDSLKILQIDLYLVLTYTSYQHPRGLVYWLNCRYVRNHWCVKGRDLIIAGLYQKTHWRGQARHNGR